MSQLVIHNLQKQESQKFKITVQELQTIQECRKTLSKYMKLESIYDLIIEEYWEYKNKVDYWKLRSLSHSSDFLINHNIRNSLNRLSFNLLNLSKLYLDIHLHQKENRCFVFDITKNEEDKKIILEQRDSIFNENLNYVIGCKLRNKTQHSKLPVSSFSTSIRYEPSIKQTTVDFIIGFKYDDLVKINVPKNRLNKDTTLDLTTILDGYIYAISQMHYLNRDLVNGVILDSKKYLESIVQKHILLTDYS